MSGVIFDKILGRIREEEDISGLKDVIDAKQDALVSGSNIKTINGQSILGSGNLEVDGHFKGWFDSLPKLNAAHPSPIVGDYAYVKGTTSTDPAAIYECTTNGTWSDSGRTVDTSNVQIFASNQKVNEVHIVNDLTTGGVNNVLSAEQGKVIAEILFTYSEFETINPTGTIDYLYVKQDNTIHSISGNIQYKIDYYNVVNDGIIKFNCSVTKTLPNNILAIGLINDVSQLSDGGSYTEMLFEGIGSGVTVEFEKEIQVHNGDIIAISYKSQFPLSSSFASLKNIRNGVETLQSEVSDIQSDVEGLQGDVIQYKQSANIHNSAPATVSDTMPTDGSDWYGHNLIDGTGNYNATYFIPIDPIAGYKSNVGIRKIRAYTSDKVYISGSEKESITAGDEITWANESYVNNIAYVRFMYSNASLLPKDVKFGNYADDINVDYGYNDYDKFERKLLTEVDKTEIEQEISAIAENSGLLRIVNISNSDKLLIVGSSSVASIYALYLKSWTNKLNDSIDWMVLTYGISGYNCQELAGKLKDDEPVAYADYVKPSQIHPTYVFVGHYKNMATVANEDTSDNIIAQNRILMEACKSVFNAPLIVGSDYTNEGSYHGEMAMLQLAKELNADYYPFGAYGNNLLRNQNKPTGLWSGAHPGTKTNNFYYQEAYNIFKNLNQPKQSIKIYTPRTGVSDYTYSTSKERNKKFTSVENGNFALADPAYYDKINNGVLPSSDYTAVSTGDYYKLMNKHAVTLDTKALVEVIVPVVNAEKFEVYVESAGISNIAIKVFNNNTGIYDTLTKTNMEGVGGAYITISNVKYVQFDKIKILLDSESTITINDVYVKCYGGKEKSYKREINANSMSGKPIYRGGQGFGSDWDTVWDNGGNCESYVQTTKYGADFEDLPKFLNISTNKIVVLPYDASEKKTISLTIPSTTLNDGIETMLPRLFRVEVYCRTFSKIYNPTAYAEWVGDNNPYTNTPILTSKSYDYVALGLDVAIMQNSNKVAVLEEQVGQFWSRVLFDVWIPPFTNSDMTFYLYRKPGDSNSDFELQIADVAITRIN